MPSIYAPRKEGCLRQKRIIAAGTRTPVRSLVPCVNMGLLPQKQGLLLEKIFTN